MTDPHDHSGLKDPLSHEDLRARALAALRQGRFDLAEEVLASGELTLAALVENLRIYQAELLLQNEELMQSQQLSQEALARFTAFFNTLPVAELVVDRQGLVKEANPEAQRQLGLRDTHFHQHFFARLIDPSDRGMVIRLWSELGPDQSGELAEVHFRTVEGGTFIGDLHIAALPSFERESRQFVCAIIDRTETVRQKRMLQETSEQLRRSEAQQAERIKELAALYDVLTETTRPRATLDGVMQRVVERLPAAWTLPELAEARIRLPDGVYHTAGYRATQWMIQSAIVLPDGEQGELSLCYRDDPSLDEPLFSDQEQALLDAIATHLAVFLRHRQDERLLRESRERYRVLAEFSPDWDYWIAPDGHYVYLSPACARITGFPAARFIADSSLLEQLIHPADRPRWVAHLRGAAHPHSADDGCFEFRLTAKDGTERWIEHVCQPVTAEDGRFLGLRGVNRDITERKRFQFALERSQEFLNATGRMARVGGWELDRTTHAVRWTAVTYEIHETSPEESPTFAEALNYFHPEDRSKFQTSIHRAFEQGESYHLQLRLHTARGRLIWVQVTCQPVWDGDRVIKLLGTLQDVSERIEADESLRQAARVFESTAEGVVITDAREVILAVNQAFTAITGYAEAEVLGETPRVLSSGRHDVSFYQAMWAELSQTGQWRGEIWNRRKDGQVYPELLTISSVFDNDGDLSHFVGVFRDISQLKRSQQQLEYLTHHDALTGLANRSLCLARLEQCIQRAERYRRQVAVLCVDLDRFKKVNDTLGHPVGDEVLQQVANRLSTRVRAADTVARIAGDEFVLVLEDVTTPIVAAAVAEDLVGLFAAPFRVGDRDLFVTASIGISLYPGDGSDMETLLRHADIAMARVKDQGRNGFGFFEPEMANGAIEHLRLEQDLRQAIGRDELVLHFQPQVDLRSGALIGVEALCRWRHPRLGLVGPDRFIPLAEDIGLIHALGQWVREQACRQLLQWDAAGFTVPRIAVNLAMREIERPDLADSVARLLAGMGLATGRLELEVTESSLMRHPEQAVESLRALRELGITLAVDDFGTGYSSLAYLKRLPLHRLKIDRTFTAGLTRDHNDDSIARAIIALGQSLGLEAMAEGVETEEQANFLRDAGCEAAQGFLFARPLTASALFAAWGPTPAGH